MSSTDRIEKTHRWLAESAFPLWSSRGIDQEFGGFVENISLSGERLDGPKRTMVQARQINAYRTGIQLGVCAESEALAAIESSADFLVKHAFLPSGAIAHGLDRDGKIINEMTDLYAQAFGIFGMANAYSVLPKSEYRQRSLQLMEYLERERRVPSGGFTEVKPDSSPYQSNPHMHLFEAVLAWLEMDDSPIWRKIADEIFDLCRNRFVDKRTHLLAEYFDSDWNPVRVEERFVFEPGHQYEWTWLLKRYENITGTQVGSLTESLYRSSEARGINRPRGSAFDEVWSDFIPKKKSARFWPQCERIKAALRMQDGKAADEALDVLFKYLETPIKGLWYDTWEEYGKFTEQPVKASSLYHIIGGMSEYLKLRSSLPA